MASQGQGCRGRPQGSSQVPPVFYQQAFVEAVGAAAAAIAQASVAGDQGGSSNLKRFQTHHPPTFTGGWGSDGGKPLVPTYQEDIRGHGDHFR